MLVDSHCHIDFPEFAGQIPQLLENMARNDVGYALCVAVNLPDFPRIIELAQTYTQLYASVGVHPDQPPDAQTTVADLTQHARQPRVLAIGETGLDYYRQDGDLTWQRERFRTHIRAARECDKPLIIHTRDASDDTLAILREERASDVGGVMHCFTESLDFARAAIDLNFYISFSGIVTFKSAVELKQVAKALPLDRLLVETDSPYLAPVPMRGKTNQPAWVRHVAEELARLRGLNLEAIAEATTRNFFKLFRPSMPDNINLIH